MNPETLDPDQLVKAYQSDRRRIADMGSFLVARKWENIVDLNNLDVTVDAFAVEAVATIAAAQFETVKATDVFAANYLFAATGQLHLPRGVDPVKFVGLHQTEAPFLDVLKASKHYVRAMLANNRGDLESLLYGRFRATRIAYTEVMESGNLALASIMNDKPEVRGWKRNVSPNACPICLGLADGSIMPWDARVSAHPHCSCTATPVVHAAKPVPAEENR